MLELHVKFLATLYTSLLMSAIVGLLLFSDFSLESPKIKGKVINAQMIDISQIKRLNSNNKPNPQPKSQPKTQETKPEPPPIKKVEPPKPEPKIVETKKPEIKQIPIKKEPPKQQEKDKQREIERRKKLEEIRKKRLEAKQRADQEAQYLEQLNQKIEDEINDPPPQVVGNSQGDTEADERSKLFGLYQAAVISAVTRAWNKPAVASKDLICHVKVKQIIGGGVIDATIGSPCNASAIVKKSILDAIEKASPLPYKGFESVFDRSATFIFNPKED